MMDNNTYGRVVVLCGGNSREREISLESGAAVTKGLVSAGIDAVMVDTINHDFDLNGFDRAFIALHGRDGEDGKIQSLLEYSDIPYTGSRVAASALSMNKWYTKAVWSSVGVPTPEYRIVGRTLGLDLNGVACPVYVKPVNEGSSIGISHVVNPDDLSDAVNKALEYDDFVIIEREVQGKEYTFSFVEGVENLPLIRLEPTTDFYDYEAKYLRDDTQYIVDPELNADLRNECIEQAMLAYKAIGMSGWGRVDFMVDDAGKVWFIELNSVPGMTGHSLVPMACAHNGLDFSETCTAILRSSVYE